MNNIEKLLYELRNSAEIIYNIFTKGSCFRLYKILKCAFPEAEAYWSDLDSHCITKIDDTFYDIGGKLNKTYIQDNGYYKIPIKLLNGFYLFHYVTAEENGKSIIIDKYKKEKG